MAPSLALLLLLLLLPFRLVSAGFTITCANTSAPSTLETVGRPVFALVRHFLHYNCSKNEHFDNDRLELATWPSYGNITSENSVTVRMSGYAMGVPTCARTDVSAFGQFNNIWNLTGRGIDINWTTVDPAARPASHFMPADYQGWAVVGAGIKLTVGGGEEMMLSTVTNRFGHFDSFESLESFTIPAIGDGAGLFSASLSLTGCDTRFVEAPQPFTAIIVQAKGLTIVSDVDDVLRIAQVWDFANAIWKLFMAPFKPWNNMDKVFKRWNETVPDTHFHYVSDAPEMSHTYYEAGLKWYYPRGTYDFRPMDFSSMTRVMSPRYWSIRRLIESFPQRRFVLIGDTATASTSTSYGALAKEFPDQVQCIIMRNVMATEPANWILPNLKALPANKLLLFNVSSELDGMADILADIKTGKVTGCGGRATGYPSGKVHGWEAGIVGAWTGFGRWMGCLLLGEFRPYPQFCYLDRASLA